MGQTHRFPEATGCKVTRVTLENDVTTPRGMEFVSKALHEIDAELTSFCFHAMHRWISLAASKPENSIRRGESPPTHQNVQKDLGCVCETF